jgi:hypothetical protein
LDLFAEKVCQTPDLGAQVHVLSVASVASLFHMGHLDEAVCKLVPHLTSLRHFIGHGSFGSFAISYLSVKAITLLAEAAGDSLLTITRLDIRQSGDPLSPTVLNCFKNLTMLQITSDPPVLADKTGINIESLSTLRELSLGGPSVLLDALSVLRYVTISYFRQVSDPFCGMKTASVEIRDVCQGRHSNCRKFFGGVRVASRRARLRGIRRLRGGFQSRSQPS